MKNELNDIVKHVSVIPFEVIKVTGNEGVITLQSRLMDDASGSVVFRGTLAENVPELNGTFGLVNIGTLSGLVNTFNQAGDKITMKHLTRNDVVIPEEIVFERDKFGKCSYRLMSEKGIPPQMKLTKEIEWDVVVENIPAEKITKFAQLAGIYSSHENKFSIKTDKKQLKFLIGDEGAATHKAQVVFLDEVQGEIKPNYTWNIAGVLSVLKLGSNESLTLKINNNGILQIEATTKFGVYTFMFAGAS